jgi:hypothetical protein
VAAPFGFTVPFSWAAVVVTPVAAVVVAVGGGCGGVFVVTVRSLPFVVPPLFTATTR